MAEQSGLAVRDWIDFGIKTVVAAATAWGTYYLATRKQASDETHTQEVQINADVRFVIDLLHGADADRAIAAALARNWSGNRIPLEVADAVRAYVDAVSPRSAAEINNEVAQAVQVGPARTGAPPAPPIRVYFEYRNREDQGRIAAIAQNLRGAVVEGHRVVVPPIEYVASAPTTGTVLRCFKADECGQIGTDLVARLKLAGAPDSLKLEPVSGSEQSTTIRFFHYEAWFDPLPH